MRPSSSIVMETPARRRGRGLFDTRVAEWNALGFTHVWMMGVWQTGPAARQTALEHWRRAWRFETGAAEEDVHGSPFAVQEYAPDARLGTPLDLLLLKERLNRAGLRLILDFVPNHFGKDSSELRRHPERFVQAEGQRAGTFRCDTKHGPRFFAHGRDPYFPPWEDTAQLDYRLAETHEAMTATAQTISRYGDGLRCDMAMLLLPEIFHEVWRDFPPTGGRLTRTDFWRHAIPAIRQVQPGTELIAEVYWDREEELQDAGFDYTYNKRVYDCIVRGQDEPLAAFVYSRPPGFLERSVHFLENHDEPRIASLLPFRRHQAAAALILFLPGMALFHDGQLEGRRRFAPIQIARHPPEAPDPALQGFYTGLFTALRETRIRRGVAALAPVDSPVVIAVSWEGPDGETDLGIVNLSREDVRCRLAGRELTAGGARSLYSTRGTLQVDPHGALEIPSESAHILRPG